jgi:hypothetical protein
MRLINTSASDLDAISLIEAELQFKHLMVHHDQRERSFLYRKLDERASPGEVLDILFAIEQGAVSVPAVRSAKKELPQ